MTFGKRLRFYLIGISLGILVVAVFFGPRAFRCSYFPNARVLEEARTKPMTLSPEVQQYINQNQIDSVFVYRKLFKKSNITNFNSKEMRSKPCRTYRAEYRDASKLYKIKFFLCKDKTIFDELVATPL